MQKTLKLAITLGVASLSAALFAQSTAIVYSQNPAPGDLFTNPTSVSQGYDFTHPNWRYNNTRNNGEVGIRNNYARSGNGSVYFRTPSSSAKADIEFFVNPSPFSGNYGPGGFLGTFGQLSHLSYDWYRDNSSTVHGWYHPVIRVAVISPDFSQGGYLVFERVYNSLTTPTNAWVTDDIVGNNYNIWATWLLSSPPSDMYSRNVTYWKTNIGNWHVVSINAGVGSGWLGTTGNQFIGAVDNITFGFNGQYTTYNFEVVPEPANMLALGSGLVSLFALRRRRK